ncbi:MAG: LytTR family DNA-binding domain-containing protein [Bacillota bacterium]
MIKIAICDDDIKSLECICDLLKKFEAREETEISFRAFSSSRELFELLGEGEVFDLFLLDVVMPEFDGISLGGFISKHFQNAKIIYLSSSREFAVESYMVNAFYYMLKPINEDVLFRVVKSAIDVILENQSKTHFTAVETASGKVAVESEQILYCLLENRRVKYLLASGRSIESKVIRCSFVEWVGGLLASKKFAQCNAHCIINLSQVKVMNSDNVIMKDGTEIKVSRVLKKELNKAYFDYYFVNFDGGVQ